MAKLGVVLLLVGLCLVLKCTATVYTVGGSAGWDISADLNSWATGKNFSVGDVLLFQYSSYHSLYEISKDGYNNCNTSKVLQMSTNGNTSIPLSAPGELYFICGTLSHCLGGMKLQVNVNGGNATSPAPSSAPHSPPGLYQQAPPTFPNPTTKSNNPSTTTSIGFFNNARSSLLVTCSSVLGTLLWVVVT